MQGAPPCTQRAAALKLKASGETGQEAQLEERGSECPDKSKERDRGQGAGNLASETGPGGDRSRGDPERTRGVRWRIGGPPEACSQALLLRTSSPLPEAPFPS